MSLAVQHTITHYDVRRQDLTGFSSSPPNNVVTDMGALTGVLHHSPVILSVNIVLNIGGTSGSRLLDVFIGASATQISSIFRFSFIPGVVNAPAHLVACLSGESVTSNSSTSNYISRSSVSLAPYPFDLSLPPRLYFLPGLVSGDTVSAIFCHYAM